MLELAEERSITVEEREIWPMELYSAEAVFITGSAAGVLALSEIDCRPLATADHPIFLTMRDAYREATQDPRYLVSVEELLQGA